VSVGTINDFDNEEPSTVERLPPPPDVPSRSGIPDDPPELRARLVSALGAECSDLALLPNRFEQFASKTEQTLKALAEGVKQLTENVLPLLALQGKRIDEGHREQIALAGRVDHNDARDDRQDTELESLKQRVSVTEAELAALRKKAPTKAQRPTKRAGRKNVR
jgi:hypothetical protein